MLLANVPRAAKLYEEITMLRGMLKGIAEQIRYPSARRDDADEHRWKVVVHGNSLSIDVKEMKPIIEQLLTARVAEANKLGVMDAEQ